MGGNAKFKVGDRVRWTRSDVKFQNAVVTKNDTGFFDYRISEDHDYTYAYEHELVAAAPQQQLRIEAGKYYKTRDGRKVGPARLYDNGKYSSYYTLCKWVVNGVLYQDNGTFADGSTPKYDIIAEWPDEPTYNANPAAEVDNLRDEYGPVVANDNGTATKFKVGDRVKFVDDYGGPSRGKEATVIKLNVWGDGEGIQIDQGGPFGVSTEHASHLRLVAPATGGKPQPAIVALIENGQPLPSHRPFVHHNREAASKEARRLAGKHKGQTFGVYELVDTAKEEAEYEWQRLALAGRQTEAVDALVKQAGIARQAAYFAVRQAA